MYPAQFPYSSLAICFKEKNGLRRTKQWICLNLAATASATAQPIDLPQTIALYILNPFLSMQAIITIASSSTFFELVFPSDIEQPLYSNAKTEYPVSKLTKQRNGADRLMSSPLAWKKTTIFRQYPTWKKHGTYRSELTLYIFSSIQLICGLQLSNFCLRSSLQIFILN